MKENKISKIYVYIRHFFYISAGIFFGLIGPLTKMAYNLGASIGNAIILRYLTALILITPIILNEKLNFYQIIGAIIVIISLIYSTYKSKKQ